MAKKHPLRPDQLIQKLLISSPCRFIGEYETEDLLITHAFPQFHDSSVLQKYLDNNPYHRSFFVVVFKTEGIEENNGKLKMFPNYSSLGDMVCIYLSILFGKRFDNHGTIETLGFFNSPEMGNNSPAYNPKIGPYNHTPRKDLEIELNLSKIKLIEQLFNDQIDENKLNVIQTAGKFYIRSLQIFELDPELAVLDLITSAEILSNYFDYKDEELYGHDKVLGIILRRIEEDIKNGKATSQMIKKRLFQVKRKFTLTILKLLNDYFFTQTESMNPIYSLKKDVIERRIMATYDLRSLYLHTGISFGRYILVPTENFLNEIQISEFIVEPKELRKLLYLSPTYIGLERIIRFCLLRFIHIHAVKIDDRLND